MTKPIVGIGSDILTREGERDRAFTYLTYVDAVRRSGGIPLLVPPQGDDAAAILGRLDGIVLAGGFDCDPALYGEPCHPSIEPMDPRRQSNEMALAKLARERGIPTLGVCLGVQIMNVAAGGSLLQDIDTQHPTDIRHASIPEDRARHDVHIVPGTRLASILREPVVNVNSSHHQAVGRVADGLQVAAAAPDGIVEGLEDPRHPFYVGVQWHPEDMKGEGSASALLEAFIEAARRFAVVKNQATDLSPAVAGASE